VPELNRIVAFMSDADLADILRPLTRRFSLHIESTLPAALRAIVALRPALVIADATCDPAAAGRFIQGLRSFPLSANVRILTLVRERAARPDLQRLRIGADAALCVPFTPDQLLRTVDCLMEAHTADERANCSEISESGCLSMRAGARLAPGADREDPEMRQRTESA
jgi:DNA-binding response OmpR family regulator